MSCTFLVLYFDAFASPLFRLRALSTMGDQEGVATQLAALLQRPMVLTAIGAALAPFLAGAPPATVDEGAARNRSRFKGRKGGGGPAQPPPPPPTTE